MSRHKYLQDQKGQEAETRVMGGPLAFLVHEKVTQDFSKSWGGNDNCELKIIEKNFKNVEE